MMNLLKVGDTVRIFTDKEVDTFLEAGGSRKGLLDLTCIPYQKDDVFVIERRRYSAYHKIDLFDLENTGFSLPEEILELVEIGK